MAFSSPEVEPDFVKISHFSFDKNAPDIEVSDIEFSSHLQSEAPVKLEHIEKLTLLNMFWILFSMGINLFS